jgi:hypothetical protein
MLFLSSLLHPPLLPSLCGLCPIRDNKILHHRPNDAITQAAIQHAYDREQRAHERGRWRPQRRSAGERADSHVPAAALRHRRTYC